MNDRPPNIICGSPACWCSKPGGMIVSPSERLGDAPKAKTLPDAAQPSTAQETVLQEAQRLIYGARRDAYSHPLDDYTCTGELWGSLLRRAGWTPPAGEKDVTPEMACLMMVSVKMSREAFKHKRDNATDGAGYFGCVDEIHVERARRDRLERGGEP